jgi:hypothetical protein
VSAIRDAAQALLDKELPDRKTITSDGPTAGKYTEMTGLSHKALTDNWAAGGIMTGCNGFTGWYGSKLGSKMYIGVFDLKFLAAKAGKPNSWIVSAKDNRPQYGDILRHTAFHVDVCAGYDGDMLIRAAGGQGGRAAGHDIIKRVHGPAAYNWANLSGWIDIDLYFAIDS